MIILMAITSCSESNSDLAFFRGKTITIIVPHGEGGMNTYARMIAPYLQKYLPESTVVVKNVPEGGGIAGRNEIYAAAPDGLTLGLTTGAGALLSEWAEQPGVQFETAKFSYLGRVNAEAHIMVASPATGFASLEDMIRAGKISMGFAGVGSDDYYVALVTARLLGYQVETRTDFDGINDASLACVRGEVDAILFSASSVQLQAEAQTLVPVVSFGETPAPAFPNVPNIFDVIPADKKDVMRSLVQVYALERVVIAPPNLPPDRLRVLRHALDQAIADLEFIANMDKIKRPINYLTGEETAVLLANIMQNAAQLKPLVLEIAQGNR
jgi:tripartite-type tricarboxylate transporter receptor subunit TctC